MTKFVFKGSGDRTEIVHAETVDAAFEAARRMGLENPVMVGHELGMGPVLEAGHLGKEAAAKHKYEGADGDKLAIFTGTLRVYPAWIWLLSVGSASLLAARIFFGADLGFFDLLIAIVALFPFLGAGHVALGLGPGRHYNAWLLAMAYRDWAAAEKACRSLEGTLNAFQLASMRARALAARGERERGLALIHPFEQDASVDRVSYLTHIGMVCGSARDWDGQLATYQEILKVGGDRGALLLDSALVEIFRGNVARARQLFFEARDEPLSQHAEHGRPQIEGMILVEEGAPEEAVPLLEGALASVEARGRGNPVFLPIIALIGAYLALARASLGDLESARPLFERALPLLEQRGLDRLLDRCRTALNPPS